MQPKSRGFSLIELVIVVAIIGVISGIAIPGYQSYVLNSRISAATQNMNQLALAEDAYYYNASPSQYLEGTYNGTANAFSNALGWVPSNEGSQVTYTVAACDGGTITSCYKISATSTDGHINLNMTRSRANGV